MKSSIAHFILCLTLSTSVLSGCEEDDPVENNPTPSAGASGSAGGGQAGTAGSGQAGNSGTGGSAGSGGDSGTGGSAGSSGSAPVCEVSKDDYQPRVDGSQKDTWPACVSDGNSYVQVEANISTLARIEAFEKIAQRLGFGTTKVPTPVEFVDSLSDYTVPEGLESRVARREDEHYPPASKKCQDMTVEELAANKDRCVGPAQIAPLLKAAFEGGAKGEEPRLNAARIEAGLLWFLFMSVYKEAVTCANVPKDCDSSLAYYTGSVVRDDAKGLAKYVKALEQETHDRIFDGNLAVRCWRDLDKGSAGQVQEPELRARALAQLDKALHKGVAAVVKAQLGQLESPTGDAARIHVDLLGRSLLREAKVRDAAKAAILEAELNKLPNPDVKAATEALDALFPCP
ncbi:MAG: hypothetical protein RMJ98_20180 [Myxococcales bacterium]|nr:hypothetical protein [Polyangiaceae bacterium]MDW8251620.1 hypothetical protein [Myxococcales bacterium]